MISICEIANCVTTSPFLSDALPTVAELILLFNANAGLNPETTSAGYNPDSIVTTTDIPPRNARVCQLIRLNCSSMEAIYFIYGSPIVASITANPMATITMTNVSPITCPISCVRSLPNTFLIPTSLDLLTAWAVARLIKLMHAMMMMKTPINESVHRVALVVV